MDTLIIVLMVCPDDFLFFVGNVETYFTHAINVRECVPPIVILFYGCVPIVIEVGLIIFASLWSLTKMKTTIFLPKIAGEQVSFIFDFRHIRPFIGMKIHAGKLNTERTR